MAGAMTHKNKKKKGKIKNELLARLFQEVRRVLWACKASGILDVYFVQYAGLFWTSDR